MILDHILSKPILKIQLFLKGKKENLQHDFQLGEHSLPHSRHNAGSSMTCLQSGHRFFMYLLKQKRLVTLQYNPKQKKGD